MPQRNIPQLIRQIGRREGLNAAQIRALLATAKRESSFNPSAVGDNGSSFGLFQHHIGGAGGQTKEEAERYLNPVLSITERAREFKRLNIRGGKGAAALQRPADPAGYAVAVDQIMQGLNPGLNAPVSSSPSTRARGGSTLASGRSAAPNRRREFLANYLYKDNPLLHDLILNGGEDEEPVVEETTTSTGPKVYAKGKLRNYKDLQNLAAQFGLNVQGDFQTTGGQHAAGSKHYQGLAVDFGDATNSPEKLKRFMRYTSRNAGTLGIDQSYYNPAGYGVVNGRRVNGYTEPGHDDHLHIGLRG